MIYDGSLPTLFDGITIGEALEALARCGGMNNHSPVMVTGRVVGPEIPRRVSSGPLLPMLHLPGAAKERGAEAMGDEQ